MEDFDKTLTKNHTTLARGVGWARLVCTPLAESTCLLDPDLASGIKRTQIRCIGRQPREPGKLNLCGRRWCLKRSNTPASVGSTERPPPGEFARVRREPCTN